MHHQTPLSCLVPSHRLESKSRYYPLLVITAVNATTINRYFRLAKPIPGLMWVTKGEPARAAADRMGRPLRSRPGPAAAPGPGPHGVPCGTGRAGPGRCRKGGREGGKDGRTDGRREGGRAARAAADAPGAVRTRSRRRTGRRERAELRRPRGPGRAEPPPLPPWAGRRGRSAGTPSSCGRRRATTAGPSSRSSAAIRTPRAGAGVPTAWRVRRIGGAPCLGHGPCRPWGGWGGLGCLCGKCRAVTAAPEPVPGSRRSFPGWAEEPERAVSRSCRAAPLAAHMERRGLFAKAANTAQQTDRQTDLSPAVSFTFAARVEAQRCLTGPCPAAVFPSEKPPHRTAALYVSEQVWRCNRRPAEGRCAGLPHPGQGRTSVSLRVREEIGLYSNTSPVGVQECNKLWKACG